MKPRMLNEMQALRRSIVAICLTMAAVSLVDSAAAQSLRRDGGISAHGYITVPSEYDPSATVTAPVRASPRGDEVRLPGGTWVPCGINCYFALRNATVDFWRRYNAFPQ